MPRFAALLRLALVALLLGACGGGGGGADDGVGPPTDVAAGRDATNDVGSPPIGTWRVTTVSTELLGPPLRLAGPFAAGLRHTGTAAGCTLAEPPGPVQTFQAVVLERGADGAWTETVVADLDGGFGLGLTVVGGDGGAGVPVLAWMGGTPGEEFCGGSDLVVATRAGDAWTSETVQATSAVAGVACSAMQDVCNTGDVTGMWPTLGVDAAGAPLVAFRDVHFGYTKEDYDSSDLEVARREAGGWRVWTVDDSSGAGRASAVTSDDSAGRTYVAYTNQTDALLRLATLDGDAWTTETVATGPVADDAPAVVVVDGAPAVVAHDADTGTLVWFTRDEGGAWTRTTVDADGVTGLDPSAATCPDGAVVVAYRRCGRLGVDDCQPAHDALRVATLRDGTWRIESLDADDEHEDGLDPAVTCDETPQVLFARRRFDPAAGEAVGALRLATWESAP